MNKTLIALAVGAVVIIGIASTLISGYNGAISSEQSVIGQYKANENLLGQYTLQVMESMQVADAYKDGVKDVVKAAIEGRYGPDGSKAVLQFIKEQNPTLDPALYTNVQDIITTKRNEFQHKQDELISRCQTYQTTLRSFPSNIVLGLFNFPRMDDAPPALKKELATGKERLDKICTPIVSAQARNAFDSGIDQGVQLHPGH